MKTLTNGDGSAILRRKMEFIPRFFNPGRDHFFLLGPRGTGKTLWTHHRFPDALRIDLLDPAVHRELAARPERLREMVRGNPSRKQVVVDEVQKLPDLLGVVHLLIEEKTRPAIHFYRFQRAQAAPAGGEPPWWARGELSSSSLYGGRIGGAIRFGDRPAAGDAPRGLGSPRAGRCLMLTVAFTCVKRCRWKGWFGASARSPDFSRP